jgi:hypothetical protein
VGVTSAAGDTLIFGVRKQALVFRTLMQAQAVIEVLAEECKPYGFSSRNRFRWRRVFVRWSNRASGASRPEASTCGRPACYTGSLKHSFSRAVELCRLPPRVEQCLVPLTIWRRIRAARCDLLESGRVHPSRRRPPRGAARILDLIRIPRGRLSY